jgi:hypothetical protein
MQIVLQVTLISFVASAALAFLLHGLAQVRKRSENARIAKKDAGRRVT